jgi:hypothetical protein
MEIGGEILLGAGGLDGSECGLSFVFGLWFGLSEFWSEWDVPQAVGGVAFANDDDLAIFVDFDVVLCEEGNSVVVAELPD